VQDNLARKRHPAETDVQNNGDCVVFSITSAAQGLGGSKKGATT
jgi:hypothetical protein